MKNSILNTTVYAGQIALFYLGQVGFLLKTNDKNILIDPYLSDYVDKNCCTENVIWKRKYNPPILPEELDFADIVICTHEHYDHADPITLKKIYDNNNKAVFVVPAPVKKALLSYGIDETRIIPAYNNAPLSVDGINILPIASAHEQLNTDQNGYYTELGYKISLNGVDIYHSGDCCVYDGLSDSIDNVNIAILPVNGRNYFKFKNDIVGNMNIYEAVELANTLKADMFIPVHFDLYDVNGLPASSIASALDYSNRKLSYHIFYPGEKFIFSK